jgi:hypothetical protein
MPFEFYGFYARNGTLECAKLQATLGVVNDDSFEVIARRTRQAGAEFTAAK